MQNEQTSLRTQRILAHIESVWQREKALPADVMKSITEYVTSLPEEFKAVGLRVIANNAVNSMNMHMLWLIDTFQRNAESEGISARSRAETLVEMLPESFAVMEKVCDQLAVRSLDDLAALVNITSSLQTLSRTGSAEEAHSWLFELPMMYYNQLAETGLLLHLYGVEYKMTDVATQQLPEFAARLSYENSVEAIVSQPSTHIAPSIKPAYAVAQYPTSISTRTIDFESATQAA